MRAYAYVTTPFCSARIAVKPGYKVGFLPIHRAIDYQPWCHGKRYTLHLRLYGDTDYIRRTAAAVCRVMGWAE